MAESPTPEAWIGELVAVTLDVHTPEEFTGRLDEVNDRGVMLALAPDSANASLTFYPWGAIRRLRLQTGEDAGSRPETSPGERLSGDPGWFS